LNLTGDIYSKQKLEGTIHHGTFPTVEVTAVENGHRVTFVDVYGRHEFDVMNGEKGDPGDDYVMTDQDKWEVAEMAADMVEVPECDMSGVVKSVNGATPDASGNVEIEVEGGASQEQIAQAVEEYMAEHPGSSENSVIVLEGGAENPIIEPDENGLFPVEIGAWYFAEASAKAIGTGWTSHEYTAVLYNSEKSVLLSKNINAWDRGAYDLGGYGVYAVGNLNNMAEGNRVLKLRVDNESVAYMRITSANTAVPLAGIYKGLVPQAELDNVDVYNTWLAPASAAEFSRKMNNHNGNFKRFRGLYRRELDGDMYLTVNYPYDWSESHDEATHAYEYYNGKAGDYWLYLYERPTTLDNSVASKGDIVWFDGTILRAERNPFWLEGNVRQNDHYDVVIVGGGCGGIGAAFALRDSGFKVALVERQGSLGGTNINGGVLNQIASPVGNWYKELCRKYYDNKAFSFATETYSLPSTDGTEDSFDKLWRGSMVNYSVNDLGNLCMFNPYAFRQIYHSELSGGIDILYNRRVVESKSADGKIAYAIIENVATGGRETISADYWIDASGDLYLLRGCGTEGIDYFIGSDGAELYAESAYNSGAKANRHEINALELGYTTVSTSKKLPNNGRTTRYEQDITQFPSIGDIGRKYNAKFTVPYQDKNGYKHVTSNGAYSSWISPGIYMGMDCATFVDEGYDMSYALASRLAKGHYRKNQDLVGGDFSICHPMLAIREGYRAKCDYMITQSDIERKITSAELASKHIIALSSWYCDIHNAASVNADRVSPTWLNGVPYEALIPSNFTNVLVACRGLGASHVGAAAFRLIRTMLSVGYAAGKAIKQARDGWLDDVRNIDIAALQTDIGIAELMADIEANVLSEPNIIPCESVTLSKTELTFTEAGRVTITATVTPVDTTDVVVWSSNAPGIASVSGGVVTAIANGTATITATCGSKTATCAVTVSGIETDDGGDEPEEVTLVGISATYSGGDVEAGTNVSDLTGIKVTATYSDGSTKNITGYSLAGTIAEGDNTITVSYEGFTATFVVTGIAETGGDTGGSGGAELIISYDFTTLNQHMDTKLNDGNSTILLANTGSLGSGADATMNAETGTYFNDGTYEPGGVVINYTAEVSVPNIALKGNPFAVVYKGVDNANRVTSRGFYARVLLNGTNVDVMPSLSKKANDETIWNAKYGGPAPYEFEANGATKTIVVYSDGAKSWLYVNGEKVVDSAKIDYIAQTVTQLRLGFINGSIKGFDLYTGGTFTEAELLAMSVNE
jgi:hypothetical protein